jgi:hypothetical protein
MDALSDNQFQLIEGTIVDARINKDLHVQGSISGGGGSISTSYHGYTSGSINPVTGNISSTTVESQEFWVKTYNGKEIHINLGTNIISLKTTLASNSIPIRTGHEIAMLYKDGYMRYLYIKNTEELFKMFDDPIYRDPIYHDKNSDFTDINYICFGILLLFGMILFLNGVSGSGYVYVMWGIIVLSLSIIPGVRIPKIYRRKAKEKEERKAKWIQEEEVKKAKWIQENRDMENKAINALLNTKLLNG